MKKLEGKSQDVLVENVSKIKELFPEVFEEGKINFDYLKKVLGDFIDSENEKYSFSWNGKSDAIKTALRQTSSTLRPDKESSKNWDNTENLFIEGDNLEVLKVLQDTYRNKIKMIYIDPPYNTGKDFVYNDNFDDTTLSYKEKTSQAMVSNADTSGRYHTNWLNMMYPRLRLARNLLTENGVIFISIDDNECSNLKKICDEIFGEENFINTIIWQRASGGGNAKGIVTGHDYILVYQKDIKNIIDYKGDPIDKSRFSKDKIVKINGEECFVNDDVIRKVFGKYAEGIERRCYYEELSEYKNEKQIKEIEDKIKSKEYFLIKQSNGKHFIAEYIKSGTRKKMYSIIQGILNNQGPEDLINIGMNPLFFDYPKPVNLIKKIISTISEKDGFYLDFFAGSASTAHAIMELNAEEGGNKKFIMVQLPEEIDKESKAFKAGYKYISEISMERIRLAGEKIKKENKDKEGIEKLDIGFKSFKLDSTNIVLWDEKTKDLQGSLLEQINSIKPDRKIDDVLYEILLKYGIDLSTPITEEKINNKKVYSIAGGFLLICLEKDIDLETISKIAEKKPQRVVFYDHGFKDDMVKINAEQTLKKAGIEDIRII